MIEISTALLAIHITMLLVTAGIIIALAIIRVGRRLDKCEETLDNLFKSNIKRKGEINQLALYTRAASASPPDYTSQMSAEERAKTMEEFMGALANYQNKKEKKEETPPEQDSGTGMYL